jgi:hypothetical protein
MPTLSHTDLERSTSPRFNKGAAYRYIRASDNLPRTDSVGYTQHDDPIVRVKLFDPTGSWTWYIIAYDPDTRRAYGLVKGWEDELGYFSMEELVSLRGQFGLPIERDIHWTPRPLSKVWDA